MEDILGEFLTSHPAPNGSTMEEVLNEPVMVDDAPLQHVRSGKGSVSPRLTKNEQTTEENTDEDTVMGGDDQEEDVSNVLEQMSDQLAENSPSSEGGDTVVAMSMDNLNEGVIKQEPGIHLLDADDQEDSLTSAEHIDGAAGSRTGHIDQIVNGVDLESTESQVHDLSSVSSDSCIPARF